MVDLLPHLLHIRQDFGWTKNKHTGEPVFAEFNRSHLSSYHCWLAFERTGSPFLTCRPTVITLRDFIVSCRSVRERYLSGYRPPPQTVLEKDKYQDSFSRAFPLRHKETRWRGGNDPSIINFGIRDRWEKSYMLLSLHPRHTDRAVSRPQNFPWSGHTNSKTAFNNNGRKRGYDSPMFVIWHGRMISHNQL